MKKSLLALVLLVSSSALAQNMAKTESYEDAYQEHPDGSATYVGKCKTHEDYEGKRFVVTNVLQSYIKNRDYSTTAQAKKIADKVGMVAFRMMVKAFWSFEGPINSDAKALQVFLDDSDDITIETIQVLDSSNLNLLRFNVGYGGGNGGYLVLLKKSDGSYQKMSLTNDHDLTYCNKIVWKF